MTPFLLFADHTDESCQFKIHQSTNFFISCHILALTFRLNIVGYLNFPLEQGYNLYAPTFDGVAKTLNIQDIKLVGSEGWAADLIFVLDSEGLLTEQTYSWQCPDNTGLDHFCWIDDTTMEEADVELTAGMGFYLYADSEGLEMQCAGQVKVGGYSYPLAQGYNITGNFCPTAVSLQDIVLDGSEGWASDLIFILDSEGLLTEQSYSWQCPDNTGLDHFCWIDDVTMEEADETVPAGTGIYIYADAEGLSLTLPAVIPVAK